MLRIIEALAVDLRRLDGRIEGLEHAARATPGQAWASRPLRGLRERALIRSAKAGNAPKPEGLLPQAETDSPPASGSLARRDAGTVLVDNDRTYTLTP